MGDQRRPPIYGLLGNISEMYKGGPQWPPGPPGPIGESAYGLLSGRLGVFFGPLVFGVGLQPPRQTGEIPYWLTLHLHFCRALTSQQAKYPSSGIPTGRILSRPYLPNPALLIRYPTGRGAVPTGRRKLRSGYWEGGVRNDPGTAGTPPQVSTRWPNSPEGYRKDTKSTPPILLRQSAAREDRALSRPTIQPGGIPYGSDTRRAEWELDLAKRGYYQSGLPIGRIPAGRRITV